MSELNLTPDAKAVAVRELRKLLTAGSELLRQVSEVATPELDHVQNLLGLCEFHFADAAKAIGVSSQSAATVAMRSAFLRDSQARVTELEAFVAGAAGPDLVREGVKALADKLNYWWRKEGLGYAHDIHFMEGRCELKLSCTVSGDFLLMYSDSPVSDKEQMAVWHQSLRDVGLVLEPDGRSREPDLIDNDQSRAALEALIKKWLPSARIWAYDCRARRDGRMKLTSVEVHLRNYHEIDALPRPAE